MPRDAGAVGNFFRNWLASWFISWALMLPLVLIAAPAIRSLSLTLTRVVGGNV